jgi:hypothetical protein
VVISVLAFFEPFARGWLVRRALLSMIDHASVVRVVEHSDRHDDAALDLPNYQEKIYRTVTLTVDEVSRLRNTLPLSIDYGFLFSTMCTFSPHHRVELV